MILEMIQRLVIVTLDFLKLFIIFYGIFNYQIEYSKRRLAVHGICVLLFAVITVIYNNPLINIILHGIGIPLLVSMYFPKGKMKICFMSFGIWIVISVLDSMFKNLLESVFLNIGFQQDTITKWLANVCGILFWLLLSFYSRKLTKGRKYEISIGYVLLFAVIVFMDELVFIAISVMIENIEKLSSRPLVWISIYSLELSLIIEAALMIITVISRNVFKEREELAVENMELQLHYYEQMEQKNRDIRSMRHDMENHLRLFRVMKNDPEKIEEYVCQLLDNFAGSEQWADTKHMVVDAIVNEKYRIAKDKKIEMVVEGHMPENCQVKNADLCTIFANLLDNAIEACEKCEQKSQIILSLYNHGNCLVIEMKNSMSGQVVVKNGKIQTKKPDKINHGYGLENIRMAVKKYKGYLETEEKDSMFYTTVTLQYRNN